MPGFSAFSPLPRRAGGSRFGVLVPLVAAAAGGCQAAPPGPPAARFPTLSDLAPAEPIRPPVDPAGPAEAAGLSAAVTRVTLPLGVSLEPAWREVDEDVLPPLTRGVWRANGLRAGVLPADRLGAFLDGLPPVWEDRSFRVVKPDGPVLLRRSPPLVLPVFADLTVPPYAPRLEELLGHRAALLVEFSEAPAAGGLDLRLTPLHQKPAASLYPRTAAEKEREGRAFVELALRLRVPRGDYAVLGLARDAAGLPTAAELAAPPEAPPVAPTQPAPAGLLPPPLPPNLGRALFTLPAEARGEPQVLLLLRR